MPKQKDLKRLVRARMEKTGEAYTTARRRLIDRGNDHSVSATTAPPAAPTPAAVSIDHAALAGMSDRAIAEKTGRSWEEWTRTLDAIGATELPHVEVVRHVHETYGIDGWWAQTVTVGYERIRGLREKGQRRSGSYEVSKSRTVPVPLAKLYRAWSTPRGRAGWLGGVTLQVRKATPEKSLRITWEDGSSVECWFTAKGEGKSQVAVGHRKLGSREQADRLAAFWQERLDALAALLAPPAKARPTR